MGIHPISLRLLLYVGTLVQTFIEKKKPKKKTNKQTKKKQNKTVGTEGATPPLSAGHLGLFLAAPLPLASSLSGL